MVGLIPPRLPFRCLFCVTFFAHPSAAHCLLPRAAVISSAAFNPEQLPRAAKSKELLPTHTKKRAPKNPTPSYFT